MNNNNLYSCPYCKKKYETPVEMARCILTCEEQKKIEEERAHEKELAAAKEKRRDEINAVAEHYAQLLAAYIRDYGSYDVTGCFDGHNDSIFQLIFGSKPWHMFL